MSDWQVLVVAKAPVPGRVKTRLGAVVGHDRAAHLAAASLLDTLAAATEAVGRGRCVLALDGDLATATRGAELTRAVRGWTIRPQRGDGLAARLAHAHAAVHGAVVQVGMDTPQVTPTDLTDAARALEGADGVLGAAEDGGWWLLGLREPQHADALRDVAMSTPSTGADTRAALERRGLRVATTAVRRDVDLVADAEAVAAIAPGGEFARAWAAVHA
jgi:uncharacterized protein